MALTVAELNARLTADTSDFQKAMGKAEKEASGAFDKIGKAGDKMKSVGTKLTAFATLPVLGLGVAAFKSASDVGESFNKMNEVFGESAKEIDEWAKQSAKAVGLSRGEALDAAGAFGNMFTQLGITRKEAAKMSKGIVGLAADFASFHNADISEVITAQSAAFRGEYDSLQRFLPLINAATVEQRALEMTGKASNKELTAQEKALAVNALMFEGAGKAAGDFARTSDGAANAQRIATAQIKDAAATLGQQLIPIVQQVIGFVSDLATKFGGLSDSQQKTILIVGGLIAVLGPAIAIIGHLLTVIRAVQVAMLFLAANPIVLIIAGIVALGAAVVIAYQKFETFRNVVQAVFGWIKNHWGTLLTIIAGPIGLAVALVIKNFDSIKGAVQSVWDFVRPIFKTMGDAISAVAGPLSKVVGSVGGLVGKGLSVLPKFHDGGVVPGPRGADVPAMLQAGETVIPAGGSAGGGGGITVIVQGSLIHERDVGRMVADAIRNNGLYGIA